MEQLWQQLATLDTDGDGQISMDEFIRGFAVYSLQRAAEFPLNEFQHDCTLRTFITGNACRDLTPHRLYPRSS
jgi:hypothetical protein